MSNRKESIRYLGLSSVRVTEAAAIASARLIGCGDESNIEEAASTAMIKTLNELDIDGTIKISADEIKESDSLKLGSKVGSGNEQKVDVALMPVEGASIIARGAPNGMSIVAMTEPKGFLNAPNIYMDKIAVGDNLPNDIISLEETPSKNLKELSKAKNCDVNEIIACVLDRPRNSELIKKIRETGARVLLISDGDVSAAIATVWSDSQIDILMGIGSAPQGVLAAAVLSTMGGQLQCRFVLRDKNDRNLLEKSGIKDPNQIFNTQDLASGDITFAATGITNGHILSGVQSKRGVLSTQSIVMRRSTGILRVIESYHNSTN